ncbi:MAG: glycoside hydrolase family 65 protein [Firmicutes bacterium HGW-Firmicutes-5]|nr:MAG: glycoside hydrolase family 65 protein [Firmicutes bacterium HGW-Firmicutes-5]
MKTVNHVWRIEEPGFDMNSIGKYEAIMTQGNGYMGVRASHEEDYNGSNRNLFVAGTYNKADASEVSELPNIADLSEFEIQLNGERFDMNTGKVLYYKRYLDLYTGELVKRVIWEDNQKNQYSMAFKRFVSMADRHAVFYKIVIIPLTITTLIEVKTGINGRMTNSGAQHFYELEKRVYNHRTMQFCQKTYETDIDIILTVSVEAEGKHRYESDRRRLYTIIHKEVKKNEVFNITKKCHIRTSIDQAFSKDYEIKKAKRLALDKLDEIRGLEYETLLEASSQVWRDFYQENNIIIESQNNFDQLAVNFALYHLNIMHPSDNRFSIPAKGLSGEGYKGHVFWDTEIFLLPFYLYTRPQKARELLEYRYRHLGKAQEKAMKQGYQGALYPWECGGTGDEETPDYAAMNIKTGTREKVWSAQKEHHIVADIGYSIIQYYNATKDEPFMLDVGLEMLRECAKFWISRGRLRDGKIQILDCIGPDEYTEHIDNNAYTNYMAWYVVRATVELHAHLKVILEDQPYLEFIQGIYLPTMNGQNILPQDDTFLSKPIIDVEKYRASKSKQSILKDHTRHEVVNLQVLKQADVIMLMYLLSEQFIERDFSKNFHYYEEKTIHDSSLSMSIHCIIATYFNGISQAYECFEKGCRIDLGDNAQSSTDGIHAASLGAIWQAVVMGFGGVNTRHDVLSINPKLPEVWKKIVFPFVWKSSKLCITVEAQKIIVENKSEAFIKLKVRNKKYELEGRGTLEVNDGTGGGA